MSLKIVTGGTTGAADGTLVDGSNPIVFTAIDVPVDAHIRADDDTYGTSVVFQMATTAGPAVGKGDLQVSIDGGSSWHGWSDNPIAYGSDLGDLNIAIKLRQHAAAPPGDTSGSFDTDGTFASAPALSTPTLTATVISPTQIDLSWTNVANEDASPGYTIERSLNGSTWSALTTKAQNVTTHSDTGLTQLTHYYYRVKAEGSGLYVDSGWGTDDDTTTGPFATDDFAGTNGNAIEGASLDTGGTWTEHTSYSTGLFQYQSNRARASTSTTHVLYASTAPAGADYSVQALLTTRGGGSECASGVVGRMASGANTGYFADYYDAATSGSRAFRLYKFVAGSITVLGTYTQNLGASATATIKLEMIGTAIKVYVDGVQRISVTDSSISAKGFAGIVSGNSTSAASNSVDIDDFTAT